ncbi:MAG: hypothetical protein V4613_00260 [Bacteroidota bacterium]
MATDSQATATKTRRPHKAGRTALITIYTRRWGKRGQGPPVIDSIEFQGRKKD